MGCPDGGSERERGLGPKLVFNTIVDVAKMCLRGWCMALPTPSFAFTLGYGITLKIAKLFAFGCLMHKDGCYVTPVVS